MLTLIRSVQIQLKTQGLHRLSLSQVQTMSADCLTSRGQKLQQKIIEYLIVETNQIPEGETLLGTSDVIESL